MDKTLENILVLIGSKKGSQRRFTEALGLCPSTVGDWKSGKSKSYTKRLPQIAEYFNISVDSLLRGKEVGSVYPAGARRSIPVLGTIKAGVPINAEEHAEGSDYADVDDPEEYFYLKVKGDSMEPSGIVEGDTIVVSKGEQPSNGDIVVALVDNESAVKMFFKEKGKIFLKSTNPKYPTLSSDDYQIEIVGKLIYLVRQYKG